MERYGQLLVLGLCALIACVEGQEDSILQCYSCTLVEGDDSCLNDPDNAGMTPIVDCNLGAEQCCIIQRIDSNEDLGTPISFARQCIKSCDPDNLGEMIETPDFTNTAYQTYCNEPKCNDGPGNVQLGEGNGDAKIIFFIDGIENAATTTTFAVMTSVALLVLLALDPRGR